MLANGNWTKMSISLTTLEVPLRIDKSGGLLSTTTKESRGKMVAGEDDETNTTVTTKGGTDCSPGSAIPNEQRWAGTATGTNNSAGGRARHWGGQNWDNCAAERRKCSEMSKTL